MVLTQKRSTLEMGGEPCKQEMTPKIHVISYLNIVYPRQNSSYRNNRKGQYINLHTILYFVFFVIVMYMDDVAFIFSMWKC